MPAKAAGEISQSRSSIVHGDYRLDNCMLGFDNHIAAVLDWEICTLGDPLADVGLLMVYWNEATDATQALVTSAATAVPGFATRAELLERYSKTSGRDLSDIEYYVAFGYWKLACIVEGVYARYAHGAMGASASGFEAFAAQTERLAISACHRHFQGDWRLAKRSTFGRQQCPAVQDRECGATRTLAGEPARSRDCQREPTQPR